MTDPRRVLAYLEPAAVYERQREAAYREWWSRFNAPFDEAIRRLYTFNIDAPIFAMKARKP